MQEEKEIFSCPVEATLSLIGGKYKPLILWHLIEQPLHYMELQRLIPKATAKMLSQQLRDLQQSGLVSRESVRFFLSSVCHTSKEHRPMPLPLKLLLRLVCCLAESF